MSKQITYSGAHARLRRTRGSAAEYQCPCGQTAAEWAYTHDDPCPNEMANASGRRYSGDINRYVAMCRRCHRLYDKSIIQTCPRGHAYAGENLIIDQGKRKCRTCVYARNRGRKLPANQRARKTELQRLRRAKARSGGAQLLTHVMAGAR